MTTLLLIEGQMAHRYVGSKRVESAQMTMEDYTIQAFRQMLEDYRLNGLPKPIIVPADEAFNRISTELQTRRPIEGLTYQELENIVICGEGAQEDVKFGGYRIGSVRAEYERRRKEQLQAS